MIPSGDPNSPFSSYKDLLDQYKALTEKIARAARKILLVGLVGGVIGSGLVVLSEVVAPPVFSPSTVVAGLRAKLATPANGAEAANPHADAQLLSKFDEAAQDVLTETEHETFTGRRFLAVLLHEVGMGLIVAAFAVFGYEVLRHVSESVQEAQELHHALYSLEAATSRMGEFINKFSPITGVPPEASEGMIAALEKCAAARACIARYQAEYELGTLRPNGYREIKVKYRYQPLTKWRNDKLRFRCFLPATAKYEVSSDLIGLPTYDVSWAFLSHAAEELTALPPDAMHDIRVSVSKNGRFDRYEVINTGSSTSRCLEFETDREVRDLSDADLLMVQFTVLQSDDFSFVSDRVTECVRDYSVSCVIGPGASDLFAVYPGEFLCSSAEAPVNALDLRKVDVTSEAWVLPRGGATFSWARDQVAIDLDALGDLPVRGGVRNQRRLFHLGAASDVALAVARRMKTAREVLNTYIVAEPAYSTDASDAVNASLVEFVKRSDGRFEETCSAAGRKRLERIMSLLGGKLPESFVARVLKPGITNVPACNFCIIKHGKDGPTEEEVFFGWGFFMGSANESVFWSTDPALIQFFKDYHRALRSPDISDAFRA